MRRILRTVFRRKAPLTPGLPKYDLEEYYLHGHKVEDPFNYMSAYEGTSGDFVVNEKTFVTHSLYNNDNQQRTEINLQERLEALRWKTICFTEEEAVQGYLYKTVVHGATNCVIHRVRLAGGDYTPDIVATVREGSLICFRVSDDNRYIAMVSQCPHSMRNKPTDFLWKRLTVRDMLTGKSEEYAGADIAEIEWTKENKLLYTTTKLGRPKQVWEHRLDTEFEGDDQLLLHEPDERYCVHLSRSKDRKVNLMFLSNAHRSEGYIYVPERPHKDRFLRITPDLPTSRYQIEHNRGTFYLLGSEKGSNYFDHVRIIPSKLLASLARAGKPDEIIQRSQVIWTSDEDDPSVIMDMDMFAEYFVIYEYICATGSMRARLIPTHQYRQSEIVGELTGGSKEGKKQVGEKANNKKDQLLPTPPEPDHGEGYLEDSLALQQSPEQYNAETEAIEQRAPGRYHITVPGGKVVDTSAVKIYRPSMPYRDPKQETVVIKFPELMWAQPCANGDFFAKTLRFQLSSPTVLPLFGAYNFATGDMSVQPPTPSERFPEDDTTSIPTVSPFENPGVLRIGQTLTLEAALRERQYLSDKLYTTKRMWIPSQHVDGLHIPITMVYSNKNMIGQQEPDFIPPKTMLIVYGAYGELLNTSFDVEWATLLAEGWNVAYLHVRGGGELGPDWHNSGKNLSKQNSIVDFLDCVHWLYDHQWADPYKTAVFAHSAGAIIPAAAWNMHAHACTTPDVFHEQDAAMWSSKPPFIAQLYDSPFLDVTTVMRHPHLPLVAHDYPEWGNPNENEEEWENMRSYSPYDTFVPDFAPPHTLIQAGAVDSRCPAWNSLKYFVKCRYALRLSKDEEAKDRLLCYWMDDHGDHQFGDIFSTSQRISFLCTIFNEFPADFTKLPTYREG